MHSVPAAWDLLAAVCQWPLPRAAVTAQQEAHSVPYDCCEGGGGVPLHRETKERRIETHRSWNIINDVTNADPGHRHFLLQLPLANPPDFMYYDPFLRM